MKPYRGQQVDFHNKRIASDPLVGFITYVHAVEKPIVNIIAFGMRGETYAETSIPFLSEPPVAEKNSRLPEKYAMPFCAPVPEPAVGVEEEELAAVG